MPLDSHRVSPAANGSAPQCARAGSVVNGQNHSSRCGQRLHPSPVLLSQVDPEYTEGARKKKVSGNVEVSCTVDTNGIPQNVIVVRGVGLGLDEKAVEAVRQYRFKPATQDGHPVPMKLYVDVNFRVF